VVPKQTRETISYDVKQYTMSGAEVLEPVDHAGCYIPIVPVYGDEIALDGKRYFRSLIYSAKDLQRMFNYWRGVRNLFRGRQYVGSRPRCRVTAGRVLRARSQTRSSMLRVSTDQHEKAWARSACQEGGMIARSSLVSPATGLIGGGIFSGDRPRRARPDRRVIHASHGLDIVGGVQRLLQHAGRHACEWLPLRRYSLVFILDEGMRLFVRRGPLIDSGIERAHRADERRLRRQRDKLGRGRA
jgi:hypothetical protein